MSKQRLACLFCFGLFFALPARAGYQSFVTKFIIHCAQFLGHKVTPVYETKAQGFEKGRNLSAWIVKYKVEPGRKFVATKDEKGLLNFIDDRNLSMRDRIARAAYALVHTWRNGAGSFDPVVTPSGPRIVTLTDLPESAATRNFIEAYLDDSMPIGIDSFARLSPPLTAAERKRLKKWIEENKQFGGATERLERIADIIIPEAPPKTDTEVPARARTVLNRVGFAHFSDWAVSPVGQPFRGTNEMSGDVIAYSRERNYLYYRFGSVDFHESFSKMVYAMVKLGRERGEAHVHAPTVDYAGNYFWVGLSVSDRSADFLEIMCDPELRNPFAALKFLSPPLSVQERAEIHAWFDAKDGVNGIENVVKVNRLNFDKIVPPAR